VIEVDGLKREFLLTMPVNLQPGAPLIMAWHGYSEDAYGIRDYAGFESLVNSNGFVIAYP